MLNLNFGKLRTVLCLGAHADDIEIGCGGTVLKLLGSDPGLQVWWVVFSAEGVRKREARASAHSLLKQAGRRRIIIQNFRNGFFPYEATPIKEFFEKLKGRIRPDLVFTHYREDRHQDHRVLSDLAWNTFRDHLILEYEVPKYDGDLGQPNLYVPLSAELCRFKTELVLSSFASQSDKHWLSADTFMGLMRLRGIECGPRVKYAEAFYCRKILFEGTKVS